MMPSPPLHARLPAETCKRRELSSRECMMPSPPRRCTVVLPRVLRETRVAHAESRQSPAARSPPVARGAQSIQHERGPPLQGGGGKVLAPPPPPGPCAV